MKPVTLFLLPECPQLMHKEIDATGEAGNLAARVSQYTYINNKDDTMIITLYQL